MATNIKNIKLGTETHEFNAKYIQDGSGNAKSWADIVSLAEAGFEAVVSKDAASTPYGVTWTNSGGTVITGTLAASATLKNKIYFVPSGSTGANQYDEYICTTSDETTYRWEKIGSTAVDISGKADKGTYDSDSKGAHTHPVTGSVTVPAVSGTTKYLTITRGTDVAVGSTGTATALTGVKASGTETFVKSYPGATSKMTTTSVIPAVSNGTASKVSVTDGSAASFTSGNLPSFTQGAKAAFTQGSKASFTQGSKASWSASVSAEGVLSFSFTANGTDTFTPNGDDTFTPNGTDTFSAGTKDTFTPNVPTVVSATDVTVAKAGTSVTVATGSLASNSTGATVMTGLGDASTASAVTGVASNGTATVLTGVQVTTQPTFAPSVSATTSTGAATYVESVSVGTTTASLTSGTATSAGAHSHSTTI